MGLAIFLALVGVPLIEIAVFIEIGGRIGLGSTLVLIVATALVGAALLRQQGLATLSRARATLDRGELPVQELLDGVCLLVAGADARQRPVGALPGVVRSLPQGRENGQTQLRIAAAVAIERVAAALNSTNREQLR